MIIAFANQKGGVGKTTNCIMLANYLAEKGAEVLVLDLDIQQSAVRKRESDLVTYSNEPKYDINPRLEEAAGSGWKKNIALLKNFKKKAINEVLLVDLPGQINDPGMIEILQLVDAIFVPFTYEEMVIRSTVETCEMFRLFGIDAKVFMVPSRIKKSVKYDRSVVEPILKKYGSVTRDLPERVAFERITTVSCVQEEMELVAPVYSQIAEEMDIVFHDPAKESEEKTEG